MARAWELTGPCFESSPRALMILPVGSMERHGDHLPLGTDTFEALYVAERVAERLGAILLPPIWYGVCKGLRSHMGTFDVDQDAFKEYVKSVMLEAWRNGAKLLVVVNGHGGNTQALHYAAKEVAWGSGLAVAVIDWWREAGVEERQRLFEKPGHAGEDETSAMLAIREDLVDMSRAEGFDAEYPPIRVYSRALEEKIYRYAVTGDALRASKEKGRMWLEKAVEDIVERIRRTAGMLGIILGG